MNARNLDRIVTREMLIKALGISPISPSFPLARELADDLSSLSNSQVRDAIVELSVAVFNSKSNSSALLALLDLVKHIPKA